MKEGRDITVEAPLRKWSVETTDHHAMVGVGFRPSNGGRAAIILPPDDAEAMAGELSAAVLRCRENDAKHAAMGTTPLHLSSAKALVDRAVLAEVLAILTIAEDCTDDGCAVCGQGWSPTDGTPIKHSEHCGLVGARDALRKALGK